MSPISQSANSTIVLMLHLNTGLGLAAFKHLYGDNGANQPQATLSLVQRDLTPAHSLAAYAESEHLSIWVLEGSVQ